MDLIKIGKYISGKRKALGLTQRELAEQLGMSDKSVSKWERGVCLPDFRRAAREVRLVNEGGDVSTGGICRWRRSQWKRRCWQ